MTPKEKANDLFVTFRFIMAHPKAPFGIYKDDIAKQCALICCDEVLGYMGADRGTAFWSAVKQEIEKL